MPDTRPQSLSYATPTKRDPLQLSGSYVDDWAWRWTSQGIWAGAVAIVLCPILVMYFLSKAGPINSNISGMFLTAFLAALVIVQTLLFARGEIDFSAVATLLLVGCLYTRMSQSAGVLVAFACAITVAVLIGFINGVIATWLGGGTMLTTLASAVALQSLASIVSGDRSTPFSYPTAASRTAVVALLGLLVFMLAFAGVALRELSIGFREVSSDEKAPHRERMTTTWFLVGSSTVAGLCGIAQPHFYGAMAGASGGWTAIWILTAVMIGGTVFGGRNPNVVAAVLASALASMGSSLVQRSVSQSAWGTLLLAVVSLACLGLSVWLHRYFQHRFDVSASRSLRKSA